MTTTSSTPVTVKQPEAHTMKDRDTQPETELKATERERHPDTSKEQKKARDENI